LKKANKVKVLYWKTNPKTLKLFIESWLCDEFFGQRNCSPYCPQTDTIPNLEEADLVLVNTCSIRDKAEQTVRKRLEKYNAVKRINPKMKVLGCMAERLKDKFRRRRKNC
jgi:tRNA-2-methylthio-N6-dimethylallyladenosine synthase